MLKNRCLIAETNRETIFHRVFKMVGIKAYADDGGDDDLEDDEDEVDSDTSTEKSTKKSSSKPEINYEDLIKQARAEEKTKLYGKIDKLKNEKKDLTASNNKLLLENANLRTENEELKSNKGESKIVKQLQDELSQAKEQIKTLEESGVSEEVIREQVAQEYELKLYVQEQVTVNKDLILSIFLDEIKGTTKEEIDTAIENAKAKTLTVKNEIGVPGESTPPANGGKQKNNDRVPPATPPLSDGNSVFSPEYIKTLKPGSKEYAEYRNRVGLK